MKKIMFKKYILTTLMLALGIGLGIGMTAQVLKWSEPQLDSELTLGSTLPIAGSTYTLAGSGITSSATSITLQSFTIPQNGYEIQDSDLSSIFYITLEPGSTKRQEIASCTTVTQNANDTATLSGCTRGLSPITPFTASTTLRFAHAGGSQVIFSDPPQLFNEYVSLANDETITSKKLFSVFPEFSDGTTPTTTNQFATKGYADNLVNQGAATSSLTVAGIAELATRIENASSTAWGANDPHVQQSEHASSTPYSGMTGLWDIWSENDGKMSQLWLDLTDTFTWTGTHIFSSTSTFATSTFTGPLSWTGFGGKGESGALNITSGTTTISTWATSTNYTSLTIAEAGALAFGTNYDGKIARIKVSGDCVINGNISLDSNGTAKGTGGAGGAGGNPAGGTGTDGTNATDTTLAFDLFVHTGTYGQKGSVRTGGTAGEFMYATNTASMLLSQEYKVLAVVPGIGGAGGGGGQGDGTGAGTPGAGGAGGAGGDGGGALILECGGNLTIGANAIISARGDIGTAGSAGTGFDTGGGGGGGGGAGGSGGMLMILYNGTLTNNGTITVAGGAGGGAGAGGAGTAGSEAGGGGGGGAAAFYGSAGTAGGTGTTGSGATGGVGGAGATGKNGVYMLQKNNDF